MNISRALAGFLAASSRPKKWVLLRPAAAAATLRSSPISTEAAAPAIRACKSDPKPLELKPEPEQESSGLSPAPRNPPPLKDPSKVPRPSEIPFQARVRNAVHLVGKVGVRVQLEASPEGVYSAVSVLIQEKTKEFPHFWIPVIFQGDLAEIAACHLKEDDLVYVTGQLSGDAPPLTVKDAQTNIQVLAHSLSFVEKNSPKKEGQMMHEKYKVVSDFSASSEESIPTLNLWNDLLSNPHKWWDNRTSKVNPNSPDFKHKTTRKGLWLDSAPDWVLPKLDGLEFIGSNDITKQGKDHNLSSAQENGEDYISKNSYKGKAGIKAAVSNKKNESLWKDLLENPNKWWDNRSKKSNPRSPDFKHKDSGEGLWLDTSPAWVLPNLPPSTTEKK